jgi:hypothetical protein
MIAVLGFDSRRGLGIFLFTTASRTALGPTQPPVQWVPGALSLGVKRPRREANHSPPSSAEVKVWVELHIHSPNMPSRCGAYLNTGITLQRTMVCNMTSVFSGTEQCYLWHQHPAHMSGHDLWSWSNLCAERGDMCHVTLLSAAQLRAPTTVVDRRRQTLAKVSAGWLW